MLLCEVTCYVARVNGWCECIKTKNILNIALKFDMEVNYRTRQYLK